MLHGRLQVCDLIGHVRPIGRQLRADGVEKRPELAELVVLIQIEADAELAATQSGEAAPEDVDRPKKDL